MTNTTWDPSRFTWPSHDDRSPAIRRSSSVRTAETSRIEPSCNPPTRSSARSSAGSSDASPSRPRPTAKTCCAQMSSRHDGYCAATSSVSVEMNATTAPSPDRIGAIAPVLIVPSGRTVITSNRPGSIWAVSADCSSDRSVGRCQMSTWRAAAPPGSVASAQIHPSSAVDSSAGISSALKASRRPSADNDGSARPRCTDKVSAAGPPSTGVTAMTRSSALIGRVRSAIEIVVMSSAPGCTNATCDPVAETLKASAGSRSSRAEPSSVDETSSQTPSRPPHSGSSS